MRHIDHEQRKVSSLGHGDWGDIHEIFQASKLFGIPEIELDYDVIRVIQLIRPNRHHDGTASVKRPPQIGDFGTVVHITPGSPGKNSWYIVECVDQNGLTVCLADFREDELELVEDAN